MHRANLDPRSGFQTVKQYREAQEMGPGDWGYLNFAPKNDPTKLEKDDIFAVDIEAYAVDIAATYVGQTSITTVGTISVGTWTATTIAAIYGGTGVSSYTTGDILYANTSNSLTKLAAGAAGTVLQIQDGVPVWAALDGGTY
jgi:hypothetical protein